MGLRRCPMRVFEDENGRTIITRAVAQLEHISAAPNVEGSYKSLVNFDRR